MITKENLISAYFIDNERQNIEVLTRSEDGINFNIDPDIVIEASNQGWDSNMTEYVCTISQEDKELLFYCGNNFSGIGIAEKLNET